MGPKKIKSKKQKKEEKEEALRLAKLEAEENMRQKLARLEEIEKLQKEAKLKEEHDIKEHYIRLNVLEKNFRLFSELRNKYLNDRIKLRDQNEWQRYLRCDRLPFPSEPSSMNTYLYYWGNLREAEYMDNILGYIEKYIVLLSDLQRLIEEPLSVSETTIANWKDVRRSYRTEIFRKFDQATFHIIRKIESEMNRIDYWTVDYKRSTKNVKICMWAWLDFPISELTKRDPPTVDFPDIGVTIRLPLPFDRKCVIVRVIHVTFDPLSDSSRSWEQPPIESEGSLVEAVDLWYKKKVKLEHQRWTEESKLLEMEKIQLGQENGKDLKVEDEYVQSDILKESMKSLEEKSSQQTDEPLAADRTESDIELPSQKTIKLKQINKVHFKSDEKTEEIKSDEHKYSKFVNEDFNYDIKEDILDCFFPLKRDKTSENRIISLRRLLLERNPSDKQDYLDSLKVGKIQKDRIRRYFKILPSHSNEIVLSEDNIPEEISPIEENRENIILRNLKETVALETASNEINLRKLRILGGVYYFDLIKQVRQKFPLEDESFIQVQEGKYEIERDDFVYVYEPPKIVETNEDEEEKPPQDDNIDKLIYVEISLPEHILWFEAPSPVLWHQDKNMWSNQHVYDIKFNEEKQRINFRIGRAMPIGLSAVRYNNLPFQTWELRPGTVGSNTVLFSLTASTVIMEFTIKGDKVALDSLQNATGAALEPILGKFYSTYELINIMKKSGVDVFPENDAFLYIEGNSIKDYLIEDQVYMAMAIFSPYFQFSWSRWNMLAGWGTLVYQTRQVYLQTNLPNYSMIMSNLFRTTIVSCSEVSPAFSEGSIPNIGFNADLYSLLKNICSNKVKVLCENPDIDLICTVYHFIGQTKFFSYS